MQNLPAFELVPTQILRLVAAQGLNVICEAGVLWLTQEGHTKDYFLSSGESFCINAAGMTLVEAVGGVAAKLKLSRAATACKQHEFHGKSVQIIGRDMILVCGEDAASRFAR